MFCLFLLAIIFPVFAYQSPGEATGFVNDFASAFSADQKTLIETKLSALERETGVEISVVTIPSLGDETIETYAVKLFEEWGIGKAKRDNGLLVLVSPSDREARIEVGYGLEPTITDVVSSTIMRNVMIPSFKNSDYFGGVNSAIDLVIGLVKGDPETQQYIQSSVEIEKNNGRINLSEVLYFFLIVVIQLIPVIIYSKSWWLGGMLGFFLGLLIFYSLLAGVIVGVVGLILDYFISKKFGGKRPPGTAGGVWFGGMGGGRGFGSGGGGFGGFGGGFSGGGGSSGRW
ncbi:MAG: TPM domain-containing protein [bacterium]|nr:TPM domain-containing protein [bacterium]